MNLAPAERLGKPCRASEAAQNRAPTSAMWRLLAQAQRYGVPLADLDPEQRRAIGVALDRGEAQLRLVGGRACLCRSMGR